MSGNEGDAPASSVTIVRRRSETDDGGHHGGVWKIAYADFMTAMMAFFLVMWLINASDKQTITQIANYFNPLRLTDRQAQRRGVEDPSTSSMKEEGQNRRPDPIQAAHPRPAAPQAAAKGGNEHKRVEAPVPPLRRTDHAWPAGDEDMGPFDQQMGSSWGPLPSVVSGAVHVAPAERAAEARTDAERSAQTAPDLMRRGDASPSSAGDLGTHSKETREREALRLKTEIEASLSEYPAARLPSLEVAATSEGLLVSLTDRLDYGMFAIASAEPRPELVAALQHICRVLAGRAGALIVKGHTDGRPFRSIVYDNWRLSSDRAYATYQVMIRGGLDERRVERIEGHADRSLRVKTDPEAAQNRRIEILLRDP